MKQITAVEWLAKEICYISIDGKYIVDNAEDVTHIVEQAKAMEQDQSHSYAEFAIRCDRKDMKILNFEDWIKLENFKSE